MEDRVSRVYFSNHLQRVLQIVCFAQKMVAHRASCGVRDLAILHVISRRGESIEISGMVVMHMSQDHVRDFVRIDVEKPQRVYRAAQMLAFAPDGRFLGESGVDHEHAIAAPDHPHKVVQVRPVLVRIRQDVALSRMAISEMTVANGENFEWFHKSWIDHYNGPMP